VALVLERTGRLAEAEAELRKALKLDPNSATAHNNLGSVLERAGRKDEARRHYERAVQLEPGHPDAMKNLARLGIRS